MTSKKWLKSCRKKLRDPKLCKEIGKTLDERKGRTGSRTGPKIKACKKTDPGVKKVIRVMASLSAASQRGDGSGAEDRFDYARQDYKDVVRRRCGPSFANKVSKSALKLAYK